MGQFNMGGSFGGGAGGDTVGDTGMPGNTSDFNGQIPEGFDPGNLPEGFDSGNRPDMGNIDAGNMPDMAGVDFGSGSNQITSKTKNLIIFGSCLALMIIALVIVGLVKRRKH